LDLLKETVSNFTKNTKTFNYLLESYYESQDDLTDAGENLEARMLDFVKKK
jgi:hypothetical protein